MTQHFDVRKEEEGVSLLQFLKGRFQHSGKAIKRAIEKNGAKVNNVIERFASYKVKSKDRITFNVTALTETDPELALIYEDAHFSAWNKPPFFVCDERVSLHRLDKETSGILLDSKEEAFADLFRNREVSKVYYAICEGSPTMQKGTVRNRLEERTLSKGRKKVVARDGGKFAETHWECIAQKDGLCLIRCRPTTGRMHQIRAHLSSIGLPIIGDPLYGTRKERAARVMLHASQICFRHPMLHKQMDLRAPIPEDFLAFFNKKSFR